MEREKKGFDGFLAFGGSLEVANVQALAATCEAPERYIRPEMEGDDILEGLEVPVIDLQELLHGGSSMGELRKLSMACQEWGFFQLLNHGVREEVIEKMKYDVQEFFAQPLAEKMVYKQPPGTIQGFGQAFVVSEHQKLEWSDMLFLHTHPYPFRSMELWPAHPPTFKKSLEEYTMEVRRVAECLFSLMAMDMGASKEKFASMFCDATQTVRMNYYPTCSHPSTVLGLSPHTDAVGLTLLLQVGEVNALQINHHGGWVPINPLPGAFVVNVGDVLEILTNGKYKSIEHRATVSSEMNRLSIAAFHNPGIQIPIGPIPELVEEEGGREKYKSMTMENYYKMVTSNKLDGKSTLNLMKL